jgi:hypothetical protein
LRSFYGLVRQGDEDKLVLHVAQVALQH